MATISELFNQAGGSVLESSWNSFLQTPTGQNMLQQIQDRAKAGVTDAAASNAINLMLFALAGGAIGGTLFKGPVGTVAAAALAFWAGNRILSNVSQPAPIQGLAGDFSSRALCAR